VTTQHTRIEEIKNRKSDFVVSRAVAPLKDLWRWSKPLLKSSKFGVRSAEPPDSELSAQNAELRPGLICLKGGDLAAEIAESSTRPRVVEISEIFNEAFFRDKFVLYVPR
jgi:16S rRNA (guanine527-N7)-methyltransferase